MGLSGGLASNGTQGGGSASGSFPTVSQGGSLGAAKTLATGGAAEVWLVGTLTANCTVTITGLVTGAKAVLLLTQDGTGGRTLTVSDGTSTVPVTVDPGVGNLTEVMVRTPDGTTLDIDSSYGTGLANPMTTAGDVIIGGAAGVAQRLAIGGSGTFLGTTDGVSLTYSAPVVPSSSGPAAWSPVDNGLTAAAYEIGQAGAQAFSAINGQLMLVGMRCLKATTLTKVVLSLTNAAVGGVVAENFAGAYNAAGQLIGSSADLTTAFAGGAAIITPSITVTGGRSLAVTQGQWIMVAWIANAATTLPKFGYSTVGSTSYANFGLTTPALRFGVAAGPFTTLPDPLPAISNAASSLFAGVI